MGQIITAFILILFEHSMLFCSGVFGCKWMLKPNSRFATWKYMVWILTFRDSWKGRLQFVSTTTWCDHWAIAQSASNEPHWVWNHLDGKLFRSCWMLSVLWGSALHLTLPCWNPLGMPWWGSHGAVIHGHFSIVTPGVVSLGVEQSVASSSCQGKVAPLLLHPLFCHCGTTTAD